MRCRPARASSTGRGRRRSRTRAGAIDGTWSDMAREPIAAGSGPRYAASDRRSAAGRYAWRRLEGKERQVGNDTQRWNELAAQIAVDSIRATTAAGSGHPTSSMSCAHLLAVLFADHLRFDVEGPGLPRQRPVHPVEGPRLAGAVRRVEGRRRVRRRDAAVAAEARARRCRVIPRPSPSSPGSTSRRARSARGSRSGSGWRWRCGSTASTRNVWVMLGDSEMAEGSVWEAMEATAFHGAGNVTAILDLNRLGQRGETMHGVARGRVPRPRRGVRLERDPDRRARRRPDRPSRTATRSPTSGRR